MTNLQWFTEVDRLKPNPSAHIYDWLIKPYVLSHALKRVCKTLEVQVISQQFENAFEDECVLLKIGQDQQPFVRQVFLVGDGSVLTYGRVVIPPKTYDAHFSQFAALGTNLIGETLLYNNSNVTRGAFEYVHLTHSHPLESFIFDALPKNIPHDNLWGRRSVFSMYSSPLLVMELLLPTLPAYKD